jgi:hypothetical protein
MDPPVQAQASALWVVQNHHPPSDLDERLTCPEGGGPSQFILAIPDTREDWLAHMAQFPACAQWCIFSIVRANFQKYDLYSAPIARALPRYIVPFFKFFKTGKCFKTMLFPVSCVSQKPLAFQKHSPLLIQPKTHAKTLSERSEKCATVQVLTGTDSVARATYLQRAL